MLQKNLIDTALGLLPPDLCLRGGTVVNVYSGEKYAADIAVKDGRIAYVGQGPGNFSAENVPVIDVSGLTLLPGYIEPHGHPMQIHDTVEFTRAASRNGMTAIVADSYKILKALGAKGFADYTEEIKKRTPVKVYWFMRIFTITYASQEEPLYTLAELQELIKLPQILCIGETTRWPAILQKSGLPLQAISMFRAAGKRPDGHTSGASGKKLTALAAAGISGCHESLTAEDVWERLRNGMHVMLRSSSQRNDIDNFIGILQDKNVDLSRFMLTADGTSPAFIDQNYNIGGIAEGLISKGIDPLTAVRMITLNPASYFRIDHDIGSLTPGRAADIIVTEGFNLNNPHLVFIDGRIVHGSDPAARGKKALFKDSPLVGIRKTYFAFDWRVTPEDFAVPAPKAGGETEGTLRNLPRISSMPAQPTPGTGEGIRGAPWLQHSNSLLPVPPTPETGNQTNGTVTFPVIKMVNAIITRRLELPLPVTSDIVTPGRTQPGLLKIALLDMQRRRISTGFVKGLANDLEGFASSHCVALGVIIVFGSDDVTMALAANRVLRLGGGMALVENNRIIWEIDLELPGELTNRPYEEVLRLAKELEALAQQRGYALGDFFHTIHFLPCDFLPFIRISTEGIFDVLNRKIIYP